MTTRTDLAWWLDLAPTLTWTFAKTMPSCPHEYIVEGRSPLTRADFVRAARVIRTFGQPGKFYQRTSIYLTSPDGAWKWWTMDPFVDDTDLINRATTERTYGPQDAPNTATGIDSPYDALATEYDARFLGPEHFKDHARLRELITAAAGTENPTVVDIGAGTGFGLDLGITTPDRYTAVDSSQGMLNHLVIKYPRVAGIGAATAADYLAAPRAQQPDVVVALGGTGSHLGADEVRALADLSTRAAIITHFLPGAVPGLIARGGLAEDSEVSRASAAELAISRGGEVHHVGNCEVAVIPSVSTSQRDVTQRR